MRTAVLGAFFLGLFVGIAPLTGCGGGSDASGVRTVTFPAEQEAPVTGDAILIETRISDAESTHGRGSQRVLIGESAFCPGGKTSGGSTGAAITTTFRCPEGSLKVSFSPTQHSLVQGDVWEVVSGTGRYEDLRGGGSMVARFGSDDPDEGRETFTGTVGE